MAIFLNSGCSNKNENEFFSVKNGDNIMPISIIGNLDSEVFVVILGQYSFNFYLLPYRALHLELLYNNTYAVVSYPFHRNENLGPDCSNSPCDLTELTNDLDIFIRVLSEKYNKRIFLYGNGLGANLALYYADAGMHKNQISGLILGGATANLKAAIPQSKVKLVELIESEVATKDEADDFDELKTFLNELKAIDTNTTTTKNYYEFLFKELYKPPIYGLRGLAIECEYYRILQAFSIDILGSFDVDITNHIINLNLPVSLISWKDEFLIPHSSVEEVFELLPTEDKEFHIYEDVCSPFSRDAEEFGNYSQLIYDFIEKYK